MMEQAAGQPNVNPLQLRFLQGLSMLMQRRDSQYGGFGKQAGSMGGGGFKSQGNSPMNAANYRMSKAGNDWGALMSSHYGMMGTPFPFGNRAQASGTPAGQMQLTPAFVQLMDAIRQRRSMAQGPQMPEGSKPRSNNAMPGMLAGGR